MTTSTTRKRFDLTPLMRTDDSPQKDTRRFASEGAVAQEGSKPMFRCDCGAYLVWVKSARTGRSYLAECMPYANQDAYFYVKSAPHTTERHDRREAQATAYVEAEQAREAERAEAIAEFRQMQADGIKLPPTILLLLAEADSQ